MTTEDIIEGLRTIHNYVSQVNESWSGGCVRVYAGSVVAEQVKEAIPAAIELLKVVEDSPPPPPLREDPYADNINYLNAWVAELEGAVRRVEERVDAHELYLSQAQNDYEKRRDE